MVCQSAKVIGLCGVVFQSARVILLCVEVIVLVSVCKSNCFIAKNSFCRVEVSRGSDF